MKEPALGGLGSTRLCRSARSAFFFSITVWRFLVAVARFVLRQVLQQTKLAVSLHVLGKTLQERFCIWLDQWWTLTFVARVLQLLLLVALWALRVWALVLLRLGHSFSQLIEGGSARILYVVAC